MSETDVFKHSTPELYDRYMVPFLFEPYARVVAERVVSLQPARILETAAGTGIVTRAMRGVLPQADIVATDINPAMLELAARHVAKERTAFEPANAQDLPYPDASFDAVVCQFGIMFFPDKVLANREARRVLHPAGHYLLVTFDRLDRNPVTSAAETAVAAMFPDDPPRYMERGPFSYADPDSIEQDLRAAGFTDIDLETIGLSSRIDARDAANGMVFGSPFRGEIERRDPTGLERAADAVTEALRPFDGLDAPISAHLVTATR